MCSRSPSVTAFSLTSAFHQTLSMSLLDLTTLGAFLIPLWLQPALYSIRIVLMLKPISLESLDPGTLMAQFICYMFRVA